MALYKEDRNTLRKILISAALNIFRSFEQQFVHINNNNNWKIGMISFGKDAVHRSISYTVKHYETTNITYEEIISIGVIKGKSKVLTSGIKPRLHYEDEMGRIRRWKSSSLYSKSGIVIKDQEYSYYEKDDQSSKVHKYGYRRLLCTEDWDKIKHEYRYSQEGNRFQNYKYRFRTLNDDEKKLISNKIDADNDILTKGTLKEIIEEVKQSILNEINPFLQLHGNEGNSDDSEILKKIASNIEKINVEEFEEKFGQLHGIKKSLQEIRQKEEQHHNENRALLEETQGMVRSIYNGKQSGINQLILFDINPPINVFTRKSELNSLNKIMHRIPEQNMKMTVIWGLGGVGKTQFARQYIEEIGRKMYENIIWINSETETDIIDSFIRLAKELKLQISQDEKDQMKIILKEVYQDFRKRDTLFIFDNAERSKTFMEMLPKNTYYFEKKIHVLITSRNREWGKNISHVHLQEFSLQDGMQLVKEGLNVTDHLEDENIKKLLDKVQNFPLSLNQAVSYIRERKFSARFTITDYLKEFEKIPRDLFDSDSFKEFDNDPYTKTTYTTWMITVNKIKRDNLIGDLAIQIFNVMSYLAPQNIKRRIFQNISKNDQDLEKATRLLAKYSVIDIFETNDETEELEDESDEISFKIHRTVQDVTRLHLKENNAEDKVIRNTFQALNKYLILIQETVINYGIIREGLPHLETFLTHVRYRISKNQGKKDIEMYNHVLDFLLVSYFDLGNPTKMKERLEESMTLYRKYYGPNHYMVAKILANLGYAYGDLGHVQKEKHLLEKALNIYEKHYEPEHYEVARILVNLGNAYGSLGDVQKKKELLEKALKIEEKHYGPDHYELAVTLTNLSQAYGSLGDIRKQQELLEKALNINEKHYGPDHYKMGLILGNLGNTYGSVGDVRKKKDLLEKALNIYGKHYGLDHYKVAVILANLGNACGSLGDIQKQKEFLEKALNINEKHYGPDHYEVARTLTNLGNVYGSLGDVQKQKKLLERALNIEEKHYGIDHYEVAGTSICLGMAYGYLGDVFTKKKLLEKALNMCEKQYGSNHHEVSYVLEEIGIVFGELGDNEKKLNFLKEALRLKVEHFGSDHYEIAYPLQNLAIAYGELGDVDKKLELLQQALSINEKHYGSGHYELGFALENLGVVFRDFIDTRKGIEFLEQAISIKENHYGCDHFELAFALENLGLAFGDLGDVDQKIALLERALSIKAKHYGPNHYQLGPTLYNLAVAYDTLEDCVKKSEFLAKAFNYF